mgnify:CR=1 FL=1|jgi:hypothetical protein
MTDQKLTRVLAYFLIAFCGFILCCAFIEYLPIILLGSGFVWGVYLLKNKNKDNDTNKDKS